MGDKLLGIFGNDTPFGRLMNKVWIVVAGNLLFLVCSIPIITIGASYCGLNYLMLKAHRDSGEVSVFKTFFQGFKSNFKQGTIAWLVIALLALLGYVDIQICQNTDGTIAMFQYLIWVMGLLLLIIAIYIFPVIASFENSLGFLLQNACFFAFKNPFKALFLALICIAAGFVTFFDQGLAPLFAFIWFFFGFGLLTYITSGLLLKDFEKYL